MAYKTGDRLKLIREMHKMNRKDMAAFLQVTSSSYSKNESGTNIPSKRGLAALFNKLGISMNWFIFGRGPIYFKEEEKQAPPPPPPPPPPPSPSSSAEVLGRAIEAEPDIHEVVTAMLENPLAKHQMLVDYLRLKKREKE
ncbi:MAG: helix-turn-helix transcriptional regulator [bacterium]|nr:helix-turn-helix transcriptional regulator [bacterium]